MKVLLVSANPLTHPHPVYPLGLDYVEAALADRHEVRRADVLGGADPITEAARFQPDVIGVALRNIDNTDATDTVTFVSGYRDLVSELRACCDSRVVLGGAAFSIAPTELLAQVGGDWGIVGEGERLAALLAALEEGGDPCAVPGVVGLGCAPVLPPSLADLPPRCLPEAGPAVAHYLARGGILNLQTKRGCPYRCTYCTYPHLEGRTVRRAPAEQVAETAHALEQAGARFLFVTDAVFNSDEAHNLEVAEAIRRAGVRVPWGAFFTPRTTDPAYWRALREAGLSHVEFGTEALCGQMLRAFRKPFTVDTAVQSHEAAVGAGLHVAHYFMLGGPGETEATVRETFAVARKLCRTVCFFFAGVRLFPGAPIYARAQAEGQVPEDADPLVPRFYEPAELPLARLEQIVASEASTEARFFVGDGGRRIARVVDRMYQMGYVGPLWERLIA